MDKLKLYRISADNGNSWSEQWLTKEEVKDMKEKYNYIVKEVK